MDDTETIAVFRDLIGKLLDGGYIQHKETCEHPVNCNCGLDQIMAELEPLVTGDLQHGTD